MFTPTPIIFIKICKNFVKIKSKVVKNFYKFYYKFVKLYLEELNGNEYPVKNTKLELAIPKVNGENPEKVIVNSIQRGLTTYCL